MDQVVAEGSDEPPKVQLGSGNASTGHSPWLLSLRDREKSSEGREGVYTRGNVEMGRTITDNDRPLINGLWSGRGSVQADSSEAWRVTRASVGKQQQPAAGQRVNARRD